MRKRTADLRGSAKVIPLERAGLTAKPRMEAGHVFDDAGVSVGIYIETHGRIRLTADQAEQHAVDLMQFVHEIRAGGQQG